MAKPSVTVAETLSRDRRRWFIPLHAPIDAWVGFARSPTVAGGN
jgi:hypothetical protein